jgi:hypothetical protein
MTIAPQINLRDGSGSAQDVVFTTNLRHITLTGTIDTNIVDLQVSLNGGTFVSDPTLVLLDGASWTFPNPASYPDGYPLEIGLNTAQFRGIDLVGSLSPTASVEMTRVDEVTQEVSIPSGVKIRRRRDTVDVLASRPVVAANATTGLEVSGFEFRGFNIYASTSPGGTTGYFRINESVVTGASTYYEEELVDVATDSLSFTATTTNVRILITEENPFGETVTTLVDNLVDVFGYADTLQTNYSLQEAIRTEYIFFRHNRAGGAGIINSDQFSDVEDSDPLYYVVTAVYYDPTQRIEFETPYSQEILGKPLIIDTTLRDLPDRTQLQVSLSFLDAIQRVNEEISLVPGSTTRDVSIDPFASEAERIWFILDFVHRSQSFLTLMSVDDANGDEVSDAVESSSYKSAIKAALGFTTDIAVQQLIDTQFEKLAGNFQRRRLAGRSATGQVVFFATTRPTQDIVVVSGTVAFTSDGVRFLVSGTYVLPAADADAYYNFDTQRYELIAAITAETPGANGNVPAGTITGFQSTSSTGNVSVTNTEATVFGTDRESNHDLAVRAQLGFVSVDKGTEGGYAATAAEQVGIVRAKIVKSGDALMMRDYDDVRGKHIGGKVDVWVQGIRERTVTETFAFAFEVLRDTQCQIVDAANLIFRVTASEVADETPLVEILDNSAQGLGVRNVTQGIDYDLTGVTIVDYQTFQVNSGIQTFTTAVDDVIRADVRYRSVNRFTPTLQPVRRVTSVVGEVSGTLSTTEGYDLYKTEDPLWNGESTIARDYISINQVGGVPSGDVITVNNETHVMVGFFQEKLASIGINTATLRVFSEDRMTEYDGPGTTAPDFEIVEGTAITPASIVRTTTSAIVSGQTVSVDYDHDENFVVTYVINDLLQEFQRSLNTQRHTTADVLAKQTILNSVDLETTIQLKSGASKDSTDPLVRTSVSTELNQKLIGQGSAQSDLINAIDSTKGVDFQVIPLAKMGYADGSQKMRERLFNSYARVSSLDSGDNRAFILINALQYPTIDGGGPVTMHRGVFQDDVAMTLSPTLGVVGSFTAGAYIIGAGGASITGYSDDATITSETGLTDPDDIEAERLERTANHVIVSLATGGTSADEPTNHDYAASYVIYDDRGPHDLQSSEVESLDLGELTLTFRSANS